ncbi:LacI family DNA-binding transcriptional regulator [Streptomyces rapamycinicus]|uniref:LacI family transcriptional regulator n=2 Tax=Streptomyces rapamycinicus TaxID=1226757 RepID=A0A3L8R4H7_STRRN|nr:LacI family DNA-binding transcriptional regulator [Streptomyces rapamycinicus]MBB4780835.1 LacI family transcriptional regulator [Streptomyces rapamycinicus]RLV74517.1 LacI family transcriptional regulator [Streptomyces rapamycinicus NRRL 5491]UTO61525.1 LacI family transcriptional regulator [Streptomyces rapamycinicus]UTP29472.1 LacI family transcriptional regulator [Streptomyces rapamycinicus NRRL 5491]
MRTQLVTIHDVARAAGVSPATVSRVFNGGKVTPARALSVQEAAAALGFAPNRVARSLRKQRSSVIALIIPDIENPFFTSLARGVEDAAQRTSLSVVLCNSDEDTDKERRYLEVALGEQMAGVIVAAASQGETDLGPLTDRRVPVVAVDRRPRDAEVDAVRVDNHHGGEVATRHLLAAGYHRIACITGPEGASTSEERLAGHRTALRAAQGGPAAADDTYVRHADFRVDGGRAAMRELLALPEPPDAVFVANNLMTIGVLDALREAGRTPPEVGVLSFGDVPWASLVRPSLTAVELPSYELGRTAADLLLQRMDGSVSPVQTVVLRTKLQVRESTAGPART